MKALVLNGFNTPFELKEIEKPVAQKGEVLVKIMASGVNPLDLKIKSGQAAHAQPKMPGAILGIDMAGVVVVPEREHYERIGEKEVTQIFSEVSMNGELVNELIDDLCALPDAEAPEW